MTLTEAEIVELKKQLSGQISHLAPKQREEAQKQIDSMSPESLEIMLNQQRSRQQQIFRLIIEGQIPAVRVEENSEALAVLEIHPVSIGHTLVIPKSPAESEKDIPKLAFELAKSISEKIVSSLEAKSCEIIPNAKFGEAILEVLPIYSKPLSLKSPRLHQKTPEELEKTASSINLIKKKFKKEIIKIEKKTAEESQALKLNRRIP